MNLLAATAVSELSDNTDKRREQKPEQRAREQEPSRVKQHCAKHTNDGKKNRNMTEISDIRAKHKAQEFCDFGALFTG